MEKMLRKRTRSVYKEQSMGASDSFFNFDSVAQRHRVIPFFNVSTLFRWQVPPVLLDSDSYRSPTSPLASPLASPVFSNPGSPFRTPKSSDCDKVGLGIVDSIAGIGNGKASGEVKQPSDARNIVFAPQMRIRPPNPGVPVDIFESSKSLPGICAGFPPVQTNFSTGNPKSLFEIGGAYSEPDPIPAFRSFSLDSGPAFMPFANTQQFNLGSNFSPANSAMETRFILENPALQPVVPLSAGEIECSEDYTRIVTHGQNPKTTHIYGDRILGCHPRDLGKFIKRMEQEFALPHMARCNVTPARFPSEFSLSFCYLCNRKLAGQDIYMYRGEIGFCSEECREWEMFAAGELVDWKGSTPSH